MFPTLVSYTKSNQYQHTIHVLSVGISIGLSGYSRPSADPGGSWDLNHEKTIKTGLLMGHVFCCVIVMSSLSQ